MPQDRLTGAIANKFGKETAAKIAKLLGAKKVSINSNEVQYKGKRMVIKCAHLKNFYIGVTLKMLKRIDLIIAAFENEDGGFDLYELRPSIFESNIRIGHHKHIGLVRKTVFVDKGKFIKSLNFRNK